MLPGRSIARRHLPVSPRCFSKLHHGPTSLHPYRFLSTPSTGTTPKTTRPDLSHLSPRKQKVELRPGPVKPSSQNRATIPEAVAPNPADSEKATRGVNDLVPKPGLIETTKSDYSEASRHGVFAPPPPDASKIGRLWHQAKEYFVRSLRAYH